MAIQITKGKIVVDYEKLSQEIRLSIAPGQIEWFEKNMVLSEVLALIQAICQGDPQVVDPEDEGFSECIDERTLFMVGENDDIFKKIRAFVLNSQRVQAWPIPLEALQFVRPDEGIPGMARYPEPEA